MRDGSGIRGFDSFHSFRLLSQLRFFEGFTLCRELLVAAAVAIGLLVYGRARFPASVEGDGARLFAASASALLVYCVLAVWAHRAGAGGLRYALNLGAKAGMFLGGVEMVNHTLEDFGGLGSPWPAILGVGSWGLLFLCFGGLGSATYRRLGSLPLSVAAAVWGAMVSTGMMVLFAVALALIFLPHMEAELAGEFAASGMSDAGAFVIRNLFEAASSHLLIAPMVAAGVSVVGALVGWTLGLMSRRMRMLFGCVCVLLLGAGLGAIRHASSLARPERPPFVMFGLLAFGFALASAASVVSAIHEGRDGDSGALEASGS